MMIKAGNVHDGTHLRHVHKYDTTYNAIGMPVGERCACGLYQSGVSERRIRNNGFTFDDY